MTIDVTEAMIDAAQRELSIWNRERVRRALAAGIAAAETEIPVTVHLRLEVDQRQLQADVTAALARHQTALQPVAVVTEPELNPVLERPLELGSLAEFARRAGIARSTVSGYVKNRDANGFPHPVDGDVYDQRALLAWYTARKGS